MNKLDLVNAISKETGVSKKVADQALAAVLDSIKEGLKKGEKVSLVGFGTFETRKRAARKGRNPQTGKEMKIAAKTVPAFRPGKALKDTVNA
jgi:DNA-binding protein HU-beta